MAILFYEENGIKCYAHDKLKNKFYFNDIPEEDRIKAMGPVLEMMWSVKKNEKS